MKLRHLKLILFAVTLLLIHADGNAQGKRNCFEDFKRLGLEYLSVNDYEQALIHLAAAKSCQEARRDPYKTHYIDSLSENINFKRNRAYQQMNIDNKIQEAKNAYAERRYGDSYRSLRQAMNFAMGWKLSKEIETVKKIMSNTAYFNYSSEIITAYNKYNIIVTVNKQSVVLEKKGRKGNEPTPGMQAKSEEASNNATADSKIKTTQYVVSFIDGSSFRVIKEFSNAVPTFRLSAFGNFVIVPLISDSVAYFDLKNRTYLVVSAMPPLLNVNTEGRIHLTKARLAEGNEDFIVFAYYGSAAINYYDLRRNIPSMIQLRSQVTELKLMDDKKHLTVTSTKGDSSFIKVYDLGNPNTNNDPVFDTGFAKENPSVNPVFITHNRIGLIASPLLPDDKTIYQVNKADKDTLRKAKPVAVYIYNLLTKKTDTVVYINNTSISAAPFAYALPTNELIFKKDSTTIAFLNIATLTVSNVTVPKKLSYNYHKNYNVLIGLGSAPLPGEMIYLDTKRKLQLGKGTHANISDKYLILASRDSTMFYDLVNLKIVFAVPDRIYDMYFVDSSQLVYSNSDGRVSLFNIQNGKRKTIFRPEENDADVEFSILPGGKIIIGHNIDYEDELTLDKPSCIIYTYDLATARLSSPLNVKDGWYLIQADGNFLLFENDNSNNEAVMIYVEEKDRNKFLDRFFATDNKQ